MASPLKQQARHPGSHRAAQRTITVKWDPAKVDEAGVRKYLADAGHPVK